MGPSSLVVISVSNVDGNLGLEDNLELMDHSSDGGDDIMDNVTVVKDDLSDGCSFTVRGHILTTDQHMLDSLVLHGHNDEIQQAILDMRALKAPEGPIQALVGEAVGRKKTTNHYFSIKSAYGIRTISCMGELSALWKSLRTHWKTRGPVLERTRRFRAVCSTALLSTTQIRAVQVGSLSWERLPIYWVKQNTDGAWSLVTNRTSCGGVIRDPQGAWVISFNKFIEVCAVHSNINVQFMTDPPKVVLELLDVDAAGW
ncbi:hypothetical protein V6N13_030879 [Hibiscus sabdariffa]|uniref:Uncharacterized protein n=1 Tax=Hibiscus sabdariffa TaxID=183260 RepID=A0ABR2A3B1_9ROSI